LIIQTQCNSVFGSIDFETREIETRETGEKQPISIVWSSKEILKRDKIVAGPTNFLFLRWSGKKVAYEVAFQLCPFVLSRESFVSCYILLSTYKI
jgi:hypothetical protein